MKKLGYIVIALVAVTGLFMGCTTDGTDDAADKTGDVDREMVKDSLQGLQRDLQLAALAVRLATPTFSEDPDNMGFEFPEPEADEPEYSDDMGFIPQPPEGDDGYEYDKPTAAEFGGSCPSREWDIDWENRMGSVTITYAEGCERFGVPVEGQIVVDVALDEGAVPMGLLFNELYVNGTLVDGYLDLTIDDGLVFDGDLMIEFGGMQTTSLHFAGCHMDVDLGGTIFDPSDDSAHLYGTIVYVDADETEYSGVIDSEDPLTFIGECTFPVDGMVTVSFVLFVPIEVWVDFGAPEPGVCDSEFDWDFVI